jgi:hypothetical protein
MSPSYLTVKIKVTSASGFSEEDFFHTKKMNDLKM